VREKENGNHCRVLVYYPGITHVMRLVVVAAVAIMVLLIPSAIRCGQDTYAKASHPPGERAKGTLRSMKSENVCHLYTMRVISQYI
jgi:hypothetical protein